MGRGGGSSAEWWQWSLLWEIAELFDLVYWVGALKEAGRERVWRGWWQRQGVTVGEIGASMGVRESRVSSELVRQ